jgi:hypothetical protein
MLLWMLAAYHFSMHCSHCPFNISEIDMSFICWLTLNKCKVISLCYVIVIGKFFLFLTARHAAYYETATEGEENDFQLVAGVKSLQ